MKELKAPSTDTLLDKPHTDISNISMTFAPGGSSRPVFHEPLAQYLVFPTIYCGKTHPENKDRVHPVQQREIFKYELQSVDTSVASKIFPTYFGRQNTSKSGKLPNMCHKQYLRKKS